MNINSLSIDSFRKVFNNDYLWKFRIGKLIRLINIQVNNQSFRIDQLLNDEFLCDRGMFGLLKHLVVDQSDEQKKRLLEVYGCNACHFTTRAIYSFLKNNTRYQIYLAIYQRYSHLFALAIKNGLNYRAESLSDIACLSGQLDIVRHLVEQCKSPLSKEISLTYAIQSKNIALIDYVLDRHGETFGLCQDDYQRIIHQSVRTLSMPVYQLISSRAPPGAPSIKVFEEESVLVNKAELSFIKMLFNQQRITLQSNAVYQFALIRGDMQIFNYVLEKNQQPPTYENWLDHACQSLDYDFIDMLVTRVIPRDCPVPLFSFTAVNILAKAGRADILQLLIDSYQSTTRHSNLFKLTLKLIKTIISQGHIEVLKLLLYPTSGILNDASSVTTALLESLKYNHLDIFSLIVEMIEKGKGRGGGGKRMTQRECIVRLGRIPISTILQVLDPNTNNKMGIVKGLGIDLNNNILQDLVSQKFSSKFILKYYYHFKNQNQNQNQNNNIVQPKILSIILNNYEDEELDTLLDCFYQPSFELTKLYLDKLIGQGKIGAIKKLISLDNSSQLTTTVVGAQHYQRGLGNASIQGNYQLIKWLVTDPQCHLSSKWSTDHDTILNILMGAAEGGQVNIIALLLKNCRVDQPFNYIQIFEKAIMSNQTIVAKYFLQNGLITRSQLLSIPQFDLRLQLYMNWELIDFIKHL
ncbi:hypothetical protein DFA_03709 [Cavenderia fasciculata]|uniref:Ankyrin repeat-containing protein n=1 Tax=Cavenderia fasciculata TaxID=261658 RepID=F4Q1S2_CACFS|nr:uncharacterized protein DFA_03709 [Cavenderia fasciculata]EGG18222.1 hypothetical protein DFA_03709 [Cavenderia fasciculata]|eukprot:XP_004357045.1 hypothetical protein DFA_03709 [Cavenderia fasciculata]